MLINNTLIMHIKSKSHKRDSKLIKFLIDIFFKIDTKLRMNNLSFLCLNIKLLQMN